VPVAFYQRRDRPSESRHRGGEHRSDEAVRVARAANRRGWRARTWARHWRGFLHL